MILNNSNGVFSEEIKIATYDIGPNMKMKLSSVMKYQQEIGERYMDSLNLSYETLRNKYNIVFMVSHAKVKIYRMPKLHETVILTTWCSGVESKFRRCFKYTSLTGELLIESVMLLPTVDIVSHKIIRPNKVEVFNQFTYNNSNTVLISDPKKVKQLETYSNIGNRTLFYSDLDYNGHVNNTVYADIICDFFPDNINNFQVDELEIYYRSEMKSGETISVSSEIEGNTAYFLGENNNTVHFTAKCNLKKLV